jgi:hypothetical protein
LIVNDTWIDGTLTDPAAPTYSENGTDSDSDGDLESAWYRAGGGTLTTSAGGPMVGSGFGTSSASWTTYFTPEGSEVTLNNPGDAIKVTWVFKTGDVNATNNSQNWRIALVDSPSAARLSANGTPGGAAYTGYGMFNNMGETLGRANPFQLVERVGTTAFLSGSADWASVGTAGGSNGAAGYADNTSYTLMMTITRNASNNLDMLATITGGTLSLSAAATNVAPNGGGYKFDTFGVRPTSAATTADSFSTSLFKVEKLSVPEPASLVLFGLGGIALFALRRNR